METNPTQIINKVLVLRTCAADMTTYNGFRWPESGPVEAPDWDPVAKCGNGLHGWRWGEGDGSLGNWADDAKWLVVEVDAESIVDLVGKVKFPRGEVIYCGDRQVATAMICAHPGAAGKAVIGSTLTGGYDSTLTGGDRSTLTGGDGSTLTGGDRSTLTGGDRSTLTGGDGSTLTGGNRSTLTGGDGSTLTGGYDSTLTGGDRSTLTGGYDSTLTGGYGSTLIVMRWNGKRYKVVIGEVKDASGDGRLEPNTKYRVNDAGEWEVKA